MSGKKKKEIIRLERVIGLNTNGTSSLLTIRSSISSKDLFYCAGATVIRYDIESNTQKSFYRAEKALSCIACSSDGLFLAAGERGHMPSILIWNIATGELISTLNGHTQGIGCLAFSPNGKYMVSIGFKFDKQLFLWDWRHSRILSTQKVGNKVKTTKFSANGDFFITCGQNHMKWWYLTVLSEGLVEVVGKPASILEIQRNAQFMDFSFGDTDENRDIVYCTTSAGVLCCFTGSRIMDRWVQLDVTSSYGLVSITYNHTTRLLTACSDGLIRVFSTDLEYVSTLPLPASLCSHKSQVYPACYALATLANDTKLAAIYADRQLIIWDISSGIYERSPVFRSFRNHYSCIWELHFLRSSQLHLNNESSSSSSDPLLKLSTNAFVTCSSDNSIKIWNLESKLSSKSKSNLVDQNGNGLLFSIDLEDADAEVGDASISKTPAFTATGGLAETGVVDGVVGDTECDLSRGLPDTELPDRSQGVSSPRCLAVHPAGREVVCGDRRGRVRCFDLATLKQTHALQAHASEVLTLSYSPLLGRSPEDGDWSIDAPEAGTEDALVLLASAGRDRLVHVVDASKQYTPLVTLDNHSSSVTAVKFTSDGKRLLSCGGDKTIVFCRVNGPHISRIKAVPTPHGTINGLSVDPINKFVATSGQDKRLNIWNMQTGKLVRAYKHPSITAELYRSDIDPSGMYVATCAFDKVIRIFDFFSGSLIAQVTGHGEMITGVRFSPDGKYLLSTGGDGCIFVWRLGSSLVAAMRDRLVELYSNAQRKSQQARERTDPAPLPLPSDSNRDEGVVEAVTPRKAVLSELAQQTAQHRTPGEVPGEAAETSHRRRTTPQSALREHADKDGAPSSATDADISLNIIAEPKSGGADPWAAKVAHDGGYELFGQKILGGDFQSKRERNKFTAQLTGVMGESRIMGSIEDEGQLIRLSEEAAESGDEVVQGGLSDEEDDEAMFKPDQHSVAEEDLVVEEYIDDNGADKDLLSAASKLDTLEQSVGNLENWLEEKLKEEGILSGESDAPRHNLLNSSLSSKFFSGLKLGAAGAKAADHSDLPLPPPPIPVPVPAVSGPPPHTHSVIENKRKATNAAVALMQEQLKKMGILEKTSIRLQQQKEQQQQRGGGGGGGESDNSYSGSDEEINEEEEEGDRSSATHATAGGVVNSGDVSREIVRDELRTLSNSSTLSEKISEIKAASRTLSETLRDSLLKYEELRDLRAALHTDSNASNNNNNNNGSVALEELDDALLDFKNTVVSLVDSCRSTFRERTDLRQSLVSLSGSQLGGLGLTESLEVSAVLERYSERLVEMVSDKFVSKIGKRTDI